MKLHEKYLISENKTYKMKEFLKIHDIHKEGSKFRAVPKGWKPGRNVGILFKNQKELDSYVENNWTPAKGGTQSSQF